MEKYHIKKITNIIIVLETHISGDSSVVIASHSLRKGRGFESRQDVRDNFFILQGQVSALTLTSVSVTLPLG